MRVPSFRDANAPKPSEITPEAIYRERRRMIKAMALAPIALAGCSSDEAPPAQTPQLPQDPFRSSETQTRFEDATTYNNFFEFGTGKGDPARRAHTLKTRPWAVQVGGHAERTGAYTLEHILAQAPAQERIYRLRCVEGWSMVIPWLGIPLGEVLASFKPTSAAKYVAFTTLADPEQMPGVRYPVLQWPYREGLRIDEAMHPLSLLATGMYGRELPNQNGAPLRLVVPWKYGFKSIKSIVGIDFVGEQPPISWNLSQPGEYGFYSNVNPEVAHPRWSQKTERRLAGESRVRASRIPTRLFNGYADQVASLYTGMDLRANF